MDYLGVIGLIIGVIGVVLTIRSIKKKKLSYSIINNNIFSEENIVEKLNIVYNNKDLTAFSTAKILIINNGQVPISREDLSKENLLRIKVPGQYEILDTKVVYPEINTIILKKESPQEISIDFEFLNPKEGMIISFLHSGAPLKELKFLGRIRGANRFDNLNFKKYVSIYTFLPYYMIAIFISIFLGIKYPVLFGFDKENPFFLFPFVMGLSFLILIPLSFLLALLDTIFPNFINRKMFITPSYIHNFKTMLLEKESGNQKNRK